MVGVMQAVPMDVTIENLKALSSSDYECISNVIASLVSKETKDETLPMDKVMQLCEKVDKQYSNVFAELAK